MMNKKIMDFKNWITSKYLLSINDSSIGNRRGFNLIFILAFIFVIFFCIFAFKEISQLMSANLWVRHTYEVIRETNESLYSIVDSETHQRGFLVTGNKQYIADRNVSISNLQKHLKKLTELVKDNREQAEKIANFIAIVGERIELLNQMMHIKESNPSLTGDAIAVFNRGQTVSDHVKYLGDEIKAVEQVLLSERTVQVISRTRLANTILITGNIVSLLFLLSAFILFNRELKRRIRSENSRKNTESQMRSIIEGANDMIAAVDMDYRFIVFNEAYQREFKYLFGKSIALGMSLKEVLGNQPEVQKKLLSIWQPTLEGKEFTRNIDCIVVNENNTYEITSNSVNDINGAQIGAIHIIRNISRRIQEQEKLKNYYEQIQTGMQELQDKNQQITMLVEMSDNMLACASLDELSEVLAKFCQRMLGFSNGYLYVMHPSKNYLESTASWGTPNAQDKIFSPDQCWAIRRGRAHEVRHAHDELICSHINSTENDLSYFCIPLMAQNDIYGLLYMELTADSETYTENTKLLINAFCELAALALANVRLRENLRYQSIRDPLTALYNRRYLEDFLFKQVHQAERMKTNLAVLMLDLDHFKKINDTFGHDAGDAALKEVGRVLQNDIRMGDLAARYGGEEFIVVFYNADLEVAKLKSEQIRKEITTIQIKYGTQHVGPITISIGIAIYPEHGKSPDELIEAADQALYAAKNTGRNKVVISGEEQASLE